MSQKRVRAKRWRPTRMYCDRCDGCGWYEGGPTLKTTCEKCNGSGVIVLKSKSEGAADRPAR